MVNSGLRISASGSRRLSWARHWCSLAPLESLVLSSERDEPLSDLHLQIKLPVELKAGLERVLPPLPALGAYELAPLALNIDTAVLAERLFPQDLQVELRVTQGRGPVTRTLARQTQSWRCLARDEWDPRDIEVLAAYVRPHSPATAELSRKLGDAGQRPKTSEERRALALRCVRGLSELNLNLLADDGRQSTRRLRSPASLLRYHAGSSLDLALTLAALFESHGLASMVILGSAGEAAAACWLREPGLAGPLCDDLAVLTALRSRLALYAPLPGASLEAQREAGLQLLSSGRFVAALDIAAARREGYASLPDLERGESASAEFVGSPIEQGSRSLPVSKGQRRRYKLDRPRGLFEPEPGTGLLVPACPALDEALRSQRRLNLESMTGIEADEGESAAIERLGRGELRLGLGLAQFEERLRRLSRAPSKQLCVALGRLLWNPPQRSDESWAAPLVLVPVELRRSSRGAWSLRALEEGPLFNPALRRELALLSNDGFADPLAQPSQRGLLERALSAVAERIPSMVGASLDNQISLGLFPWERGLLWAKVDEHGESWIQGPLLAELLEPASRPQSDQGEDATFKLCPAPRLLDQAQSLALEASAAGRSAVVLGGPGSGKTELACIAAATALGQGRRVLYISSQAASRKEAIRRWRNLGLGPYLLDLNKSRSGLLEQLMRARAANPATQGVSRDFETVRRWAGALERSWRALHARRSLGSTLAEGLARLAALSDTRPLCELPVQGIAGLRGAELSQRKAALVELESARRGLSREPAKHTLRVIALEDGAQADEESFEQQLGGLANSAQRLWELGKDVSRELPVTQAEPTPAWLAAIPPLCALIARSPSPPETLLREPACWQQAEALLAEERSCEIEEARLRERLSERWTEELFELPLETLIRDGRAHLESGFIARWWGLAAARRSLRKVARAEALPALDLIVSDLEDAATVLTLETRRSRLREDIRPLLGLSLDERSGLSWERVAEILGWCRELREGLDRLDQRTSGLLEREALWRLACHSRPLERARLQALGAPLEATLQAFERRVAIFRERFAVDLDALASCDWESQSFARLAAAFTDLQQARAELVPWVRYRAAQAEARSAGVEESAIAAAEDAQGELSERYEKSVLEAWSRDLIEADEALALFDTRPQERAIAHLKRAISEAEGGEASRILLALAQARRSAMAEAQDALGRLIVAAKQSHPEERYENFLTELLPAIQVLCPLMVASPEQVVRWPAGLAYELLLIDDAATLTLAEAMPALARCEQVLVLGDPSLQPFPFIEDEQDDSLALAATGSVLETAQRSGFTATELTRSDRAEPLLGLLMRGPEATPAISWPRPISAPRVAELVLAPRARLDIDAGEAVVQAEIDSIAAILSSSRGDSCGLIAATVAQRDALRERFSNQAEFIVSCDEALGHQAQTVILSLALALDARGHLPSTRHALRHPLAQQRIRRALSRAKERLVVVSGLGQEELKDAPGAAAIRELLGRLERASRPQQVQLGRDLAAELCEPLAKGLESRGWRLWRRPGWGPQRPVLAIASPLDPQRPLLGVLCDADHEASLLDREKAWAGGLESLSWTLHRVWSLELYQEPERVLEELQRRLVELADRELAHSPAPMTVAPTEVLERGLSAAWSRASKLMNASSTSLSATASTSSFANPKEDAEAEDQEAEPWQLALAAAEREDQLRAQALSQAEADIGESPEIFVEPEVLRPAPAAASDLDPALLQAKAEPESLAREALTEAPANSSAEAIGQESSQPASSGFVKPEPEEPAAEPANAGSPSASFRWEPGEADETGELLAPLEGGAVYRSFVVTTPLGEPQDFYSRDSVAQVQEAILAILETESPLHERELGERLAPLFRLSRVVARVRMRIDKLLSEEPLASLVTRREEFLWLGKAQELSPPRRPGPEGRSRAIELIAPEERMAAILQALEQAGGQASREDIYRDAARMLGFPRLSSKVREAFERAIRSLRKSERLQTDDAGGLRLVSHQGG